MDKIHKEVVLYDRYDFLVVFKPSYKSKDLDIFFFKGHLNVCCSVWYLLLYGCMINAHVRKAFSIVNVDIEYAIEHPFCFYS